MNYYLSNNGSDSNSGTSIEYPYKTIEKINSVISKNDNVYIECNSVYYEKLKTYKGCTINSYGVGDKPIFDFSTILNSIQNIIEENGLCKISLSDTSLFNGHINTSVIDNIGFIIVNGDIYANKKFSKELLTDKFDFYSGNSTLYIKCSKSDIFSLAFCTNENMLTLYNDMTVKNITFKNTGGHGINFTCDNILIEKCDFINIGGSYLREDGTRYGNGVQIWTKAKNCDINNCYFENIYDTATTIQGDAKATNKYEYVNISIHHNTIKKCAQSFELWVKGTTDSVIRNCCFNDNICIETGKGSLPLTRPDKSSNCHILFYETRLYNEKMGVTIENNIFEVEDYPLYFFAFDPKYDKADNNLIIGYEDSKLLSSADFTIKDKNDFINSFNYDRNSKFLIKDKNKNLYGLLNSLLIENYKKSKMLKQVLTSSSHNDTLTEQIADGIVIPYVTSSDDSWNSIARITCDNVYSRGTFILNYTLCGDEMLCGDSGFIKIHIAFKSSDKSNASGVYYNQHFTNKYIINNNCFILVYNNVDEKHLFDLYYKTSTKVYAKLKIKMIDSYSSTSTNFEFKNDIILNSITDIGTIIESTLV